MINSFYKYLVNFRNSVYLMNDEDIFSNYFKIDEPEYLNINAKTFSFYDGVEILNSLKINKGSCNYIKFIGNYLVIDNLKIEENIFEDKNKSKFLEIYNTVINKNTASVYNSRRDFFSTKHKEFSRYFEKNYSNGKFTKYYFYIKDRIRMEKNISFNILSVKENYLHDRFN